MITFSDPPLSWTAESTRPENEIRRIFYTHWEKIANKVTESVNKINEWRQKMIADINKYADEQLKHIENDYIRQRAVLDQSREEYLETTRAYVCAQNSELFQELRIACEKLEFQIVQLEIFPGTMVGIKVVTVQEQIERIKQQQASTPSNAEEIKPEVKSEDPQAINAQNKLVENGPATSVLQTSNDIHSSTLMVKSSNESTQSAAVHNDSQNEAGSNVNLIDKCPLCFMIFPSTMPPNERSQHVNEHYSDD